MEKPDNIEEKFRESFSGFIASPPDRVWEELRNNLHPVTRAEGFWTRFIDFTKPSPVLVRTYTGIAMASVILFLAIVYFVVHDHHSIRGHAYAGETRLCGGSAILYKVEDKIKPLDSIDHYSTVDIDNNGYFLFQRVETGRYLLRISPPVSSETTEKFQPSWFDQHINPDESDMIVIASDDVNADVHLQQKPGDKK
ncbi:MAG: hypothetical protein WCI71_14920 [Bacteroidota bacterium]